MSSLMYVTITACFTNDMHLQYSAWLVVLAVCAHADNRLFQHCKNAIL